MTDNGKYIFWGSLGLISFLFLLLILTTPKNNDINDNTYDSPNKILPNVKGDILTNNLTIICVSGYSSTVRDVPQSLRKKIFARDNVSYPQPTGTTELDHLVPLCLGGSNSEENLWVQFAPEYKEKDKLENYLCDNVCDRKINITYAQQRIADNWYSYYAEILETVM
jgi:hypothetical protein